MFRIICVLIFCLFTGFDLFACPQGKYAVRSHDRGSYYRADGTFVSSAHIKAHCKEFSPSYQYFLDRFKEEISPLWPHKNEKSAPWTEEQKIRVIEALDELPQILKSEKIKGIYRMKKSKDGPNPGAGAEGIIVLYDSAFKNDRNLARILAHELAHQSYYELSEIKRQDYRRATDWKLKASKDLSVFYWVERKSGFVEEDGKNSPQEDYANNLEYFIFSPDKLKEVMPAAYDWFRKEFRNKLKLNQEKK